MTRNEIAAKVAKGSPFIVELVKGQGCWYFTASSPALNFYETRTVYTMRLSDQKPARWIEEGEDFVAECIAQLESR